MYTLFYIHFISTQHTMIDSKVLEAIEEVKGHLIWNKKYKSKGITFQIKCESRSAGAWYHMWKSGDDLKGLEVRYVPTCDVKNCISHHLPLQPKLKSIYSMTIYDYEYYCLIIAKNSTRVGNCGKDKSGYGTQHYFGRKPHQAVWCLKNFSDITEGVYQEQSLCK